MQWAVGEHGWPVGQWLIPAGTILTGVSDGAGGIATPPSWGGITLPISNTVPAPIDFIILDAEASAIMKKWYSDTGLDLRGWGTDQRYRLRFAPGVT
jgi:hypothetical protein